MRERVLPTIVRWYDRLVMPRLNRPDLWLLVATAGLLTIGVVMIFNASYFMAQERYNDSWLLLKRHLAYLLVGLTAALALSRLRLELLQRLAYPAMIVAIIMLLMVLIPGIGVIRGGARRWINLGLFTFQPAEFVKIAVALYLAKSVIRKGARIQLFLDGVLPHLVVVGASILLIAKQPDLGTATILSMLLFTMLHGAGARTWQLLALGLAALPGVAYAVMHKEYQMKRIMGFLNPWDHSQDISFQLVQSLLAFGSGGLTGSGLGDGQQKLFFLPEVHTDFIFALIGEELGLGGALLVLGLFALFGIRGFRVAVRHPDPFASMLAFGLTLIILLEALVNVGVVIGLLPTKGLALPFLSYGGTALIGTLVQVGILAGLSRQTG